MVQVLHGDSHNVQTPFAPLYIPVGQLVRQSNWYKKVPVGQDVQLVAINEHDAHFELHDMQLLPDSTKPLGQRDRQFVTLNK